MLDKVKMQTQRVFDLFESVEKRNLSPQQKHDFRQIEAMFWVAKDTNRPLSPAIEALNKFVDDINKN